MSGESTLLPDGRPEGANLDFYHRAAAHCKILDRDQALVETVPRRDKVALIGFSESSRHLGPYEDETYEIWGLNQVNRMIPRADRWFDIHHNWDEHVVEGTDHLGFLQAFPGPIYMTQRIKTIPNSVRFPIEDCIAITGLDYFQSTIGFMMALAIRDGFKTIALYGIDLVCGEEWDYQKPNAEWWIGYALGRGIEVLTSEKSALCRQSYRYGYESEPKSLVLLSELKARKVELQNKRQQAIVNLAACDGALQDAEMWLELATLRHHHSNVAYTPGKPKADQC